ncbi:MULTISPECIES: uracil-DNA glycosylase [unclassified Oceanispirochaeta]|uniref:uracil-DNA glycosylase n=1 Tax=unclassified Oceanispirochaeta TaxID=2635722 RepID=UPI000E096C40|nr:MULTISPECIES: uracil-DNA glycosylase [unclassified Oceanispirochaeta]MBF9015520.1 uracil-DNA glycosylase [Oceanispirochaeta sp. M2]NPD71979.1 uracil-DNA glycosylase [Oceanispirochaeta sp. M1]RDG32785.1 uracil-DNA glycosylase [Oceanispirochaeta sp. M1]
MNRDIKLESSWLNVVNDEFDQPYMDELRQFLVDERQKGKTLFPPESQVFYALDRTPFDKVKVVILGQDPYHGPGQAHGLCFSVQPGVAPPPSLVNIYKEMGTDLGLTAPNHGCLSSWADQGVLLLNSVLTVEAHQAGSHQGRGWEKFTDRVIRELESRRENLVFILWGGYARKKGSFINRDRHLVIESPHPSPLSSYRGFFGSKPFSRSNEYLQQTGQTEIEWKLPMEGML